MQESNTSANNSLTEPLGKSMTLQMPLTYHRFEAAANNWSVFLFFDVSDDDGKEGSGQLLELGEVAGLVEADRELKLRKWKTKNNFKT